MVPRHVLTADQFDRDSIETIFRTAASFQDESASAAMYASLIGCRVGIYFFEPSTRTRTSFEVAAQLLGAHVVVSENAKHFSSFAKGESIEDMFQTLERYRMSAFVIRSDAVGAPAAVARVVGIPVLNAGDGAGEHPSQALLDWYTIRNILGDRLERECTIALCGDLANGRTVRSLCRIVKRAYDGASCPIRFLFCAPPSLGMKNDILRELIDAEILFDKTDDFEEALRAADVLYHTRVQKERFTDRSQAETAFETVQANFRLHAGNIRLLQENACVLHPLPRLGEIDREIDRDPRIRIFSQAENGLYVRMALLLWCICPTRF